MTNGNIDARGAFIANSKRQKNEKTESFLESFLKNLEGITGKDNYATKTLEQHFKPYMAGEVARQQEEHRNKRAGHRKKAPFSFNTPSETFMIDTIIRRREVTNKRILKTWKEIKKMEDDAVKYSDEDRKIRELVDVKNAADGMIHSVKKSITFVKISSRFSASSVSIYF